MTIMNSVPAAFGIAKSALRTAALVALLLGTSTIVAIPAHANDAGEGASFRISEANNAGEGASFRVSDANNAGEGATRPV